jgi:glycosyltransferase involved in cell wall biosynthesis
MLIQNGSNGFIVETNVVSSFYEALIKLIESDTLRVNFGETLRQDITNNYSEETIVNEYINWVQNSCK